MYALYTLRTAMLPVGVVEWLWRRAGPFTRSLVVLTLLGAGVYAGLLGLTPHPATSTYRVTWAAGAPYKCDGALEFNMVDHPNYWLTVCSVDLAAYLSATGEGPYDLVLRQTYLLGYTIYAIERVGEWMGTATLTSSYERCPSTGCMYPDLGFSPFHDLYTLK